jgi:ribosomal protein S18 acetylase RimI-like enzyme
MIELRELKVEDYDEIVEVWQKAGLPFKPAGRDARQEIAKQMQRNPDLFLGAFDGKKLVGVCIGTEDGRKGWINRIAVLPEYQRRGIATMMITEMERRLKSRGMGIICVLIEDWNNPSLALFQKHGYVLHKDIYYLSKRENAEI